MKEVTIDAEIWHGKYHKKISASAENIAKALKKLGQINSYCPQTDRQSNILLIQLLHSGRGVMGWVTYKLA